MEALSEYLTAARTRASVNLSNCIWMPVTLSEDDGPVFAVAELKIDEYTVKCRLRVDGELFRTQPMAEEERPISLVHGTEYYALGIPDAVCESLGAGEGDYALIRRKRHADQEGPGVLETLSGPEFGNFERDDEGNINFVCSGARVIGGEDIGEDLQVGYVTALLKPIDGVKTA